MAFFHQFNPTSLREYDIRGTVGRTLSEADAFAIGRCFGTIVSREGGRTVAVGYDGRLSSPAMRGGLSLSRAVLNTWNPVARSSTEAIWVTSVAGVLSFLAFLEDDTSELVVLVVETESPPAAGVSGSGILGSM